MNEQIEEIKEWIEKADHDLGSAKIIYLHLPEYFDTIAFHCQQAVEKYIKAILIYNKIDFIKSHDLVYLLDLLSRSIEVDELKFKKAFNLNNFGVQIRYPNKIIKLTKEELEFEPAVPSCPSVSFVAKKQFAMKLRSSKVQRFKSSEV